MSLFILDKDLINTGVRWEMEWVYHLYKYNNKCNFKSEYLSTNAINRHDIQNDGQSYSKRHMIFIFIQEQAVIFR